MLTPSSGSITSLSASSIWSKSAGARAVGMVLGYARVGVLDRRREPVVALVLETVGQFGPTLLGDAAVDEHVHEVRLDVAEDARVVGDEEDAEARVGLGAVDALRDDLERIHVEARVGLVEDRE